jgi:hypothetical protein
MIDVRQKAKDLHRLAIDDGASEGERKNATAQLLKLIGQYDLLSAGGKPIHETIDYLKRMLSPEGMEDFASRFEKAANVYDRIGAAAKRIVGESDRKRRRYR